ncbi:MAG: cysteine desulfurase [Bacteroidia bacterium]|nr:cysteine desulfurase [Bacteroidia bacterium]
MSIKNIEAIRMDFPVLHQKVHGKPWVYLDNAASGQKPLPVINAISEYYLKYHSNVHRGVHYMSQLATDKFEAARKTVQHFLNAEHDHEIIWTTGTTEGINLVAATYGRKFLKEGDEILITGMEHHANIVPWQMLCEEKGCVLRVVPVLENGTLDMASFYELFSDKTRFLSVVHVSNALGTLNPVKEMIKHAHSKNIPVLLDGAQSSCHFAIDVQDLDCDFFVFSGHKVFGPTGIGVLYGKTEYLEKMPPYKGGGEMIETVTFEKTTYAGLPFKFEAGTPDIANAIGLAAAMDYIHSIGWDVMEAQEKFLLEYATEEILKIGGIKLYGTSPEKCSVLSFLIEGIHPYDTGTILDKMGIAVRTGHHCAQPLMGRFCIPGTVRASFAFYNTKEEVDALISGLKRIKTMFL